MVIVCQVNLNAQHKTKHMNQYIRVFAEIAGGPEFQFQQPLVKQSMATYVHLQHKHHGRQRPKNLWGWGPVRLGSMRIPCLE